MAEELDFVAPMQDGREMKHSQNGLGIGGNGDPSYTLLATAGQSVAYSVREDAKSNTFSATELEVTTALQAQQPSVQSHHAQTFIVQAFEPGAMSRLPNRRLEDVAQTLRAHAGDNQQAVLIQESVAISYDGYNQNVEVETHRPLRVGRDSSDFVAMISLDEQPDLPFSAGFSYGNSATARSIGYQEEQSPTLRAAAGGNSIPVIVHQEAIELPPATPTGNLTPWPEMGEANMVYRDDTPTRTVKEDRHLILSPTVVAAIDRGAGNTQDGYIMAVTQAISTVRRLTPMECERLQGFDDGWTAFRIEPIKGVVEQADSARYKQMGNAVAVPCVAWIVANLIAVDAEQ